MGTRKTYLVLVIYASPSSQWDDFRYQWRQKCWFEVSVTWVEARTNEMPLAATNFESAYRCSFLVGGSKSNIYAYIYLSVYLIISLLGINYIYCSFRFQENLVWFSRIRKETFFRIDHSRMMNDQSVLAMTTLPSMSWTLRLSHPRLLQAKRHVIWVCTTQWSFSFFWRWSADINGTTKFEVNSFVIHNQHSSGIEIIRLSVLRSYLQ